LVGQAFPTRIAEHSWLRHLLMTRFAHLVKAFNADTVRLRLRAPVFTLVLAATAIPIELRPLGSAGIDFGVGFWDVLANIAGYFPVGIVLGEFGLARAILSAGLLSAFAESIQLVLMHRTPSAIDVVTNLTGATLGAFVCSRCRICSPALIVNRFRATVALGLAVMICLGLWVDEGPSPNNRGVTVPGILEADWKFDEGIGGGVGDSSGHGLSGRPVHRPTRAAGVLGNAIVLDGKKDAVNLGRPSALRLVGSMTICAWIKSASFPADDAAIISSLKSSDSQSDTNSISHKGTTMGYQLDTTIDRGSRTIGFKLSNACGELMARYGTTPLVLNTWTHIAGVYDATARTLDVYLNGKLDNGFLLGAVSSTQHSSRKPVYIGRRSSDAGFEFAGAIDDVRIYSLALTKPQLLAAMGGIDIGDSRTQGTYSVSVNQPAYGGLGLGNRCAVLSDPEDSMIPVIAGSLGALAAIACAGLWSTNRKMPCLVVSLGAGLLVTALAPASLPPFNLWLIPLTSLAGGGSVAVSLYRPSAVGAPKVPKN
jgi:VanZ family protein